MRRAFVRTLAVLAGEDRRIVLLTGDLGFTVVEPFAEKFPERFFNVGVAEQNMVGLATGLAEAGFIPFVYSIATFATLRAYEFVRNGPVLHRWPVRVIGVGGGFEYGSNGPSHFALEDVGLMRMQPGLTVVAPADHLQAASALRATWDLPGPIYYRLGKDDETLVEGLDGRFRLGHSEELGHGTDVVLITMGAIATEVVAAATALQERGVASTVAILSTLDAHSGAALAELLARFTLALTVEAHYRAGGLGSLVAEVIAERGLGCRLVRCGVEALRPGISGSQRSLEREHGLARDGLVATALRALASGAGGP